MGCAVMRNAVVHGLLARLTEDLKQLLSRGGRHTCHMSEPQHRDLGMMATSPLPWITFQSYGITDSEQARGPATAWVGV